MAKRLTKKQIEDFTKQFIAGINIEKLSDQFNCSKLTIARNLKKSLGENYYKELLAKSKLTNNKKKFNYLTKDINNTNKKNNKNNGKEIRNEKIKKDCLETAEFIEIAPLIYDVENSPQKDLSSVSISDITLPKIVFMIVDKNIELEIKYLKDYPQWQFLSQNELNRKTIEIYFDLKIAKSFCGKEHKVIKVPNTSVFKIVAPILISRGISRIVSSDKLIAL